MEVLEAQLVNFQAVFSNGPSTSGVENPGSATVIPFSILVLFCFVPLFVFLSNKKNNT